jgi:hypothetical protein
MKLRMQYNSSEQYKAVTAIVEEQLYDDYNWNNDSDDDSDDQRETSHFQEDSSLLTAEKEIPG